ncbi:MAG: M1 family metallopeptidase [Verrucomicrobia bacterium]|nr:M1 family metallopeptidase [Verrucomicrobiota bacterium]
MPLQTCAACRLLLFLFLLAGPYALRAVEPEFASTTLPAVPLRYLLHLEPDPATQQLEGAEDIQLEVRSSLREITLNAAELEVTQAVLHAPFGEVPLQPELDEATEQLRLTAEREIVPGEYHLGLRFRGKIHRESHGLSLVARTNAPNAPAIVATELAPCAAREVFPCFDEPGIRAKIQVSVKAGRNDRVLSNMPAVAEQAIGPNAKVVMFAESPPMPVYLFSFICGEFTALEDNASGVPIRFFTVPGSESLARYALDATKQLLRYYEDYFGFPLPLPKLDQVALPAPWSGTAVGWGTVIYPADLVLRTSEQTTLAAQTEVFTHVARALARQWFGGLIGFASWDDLWLSEGLAAWMEAKATERFHPDWKYWLAQTPRLDELMLTDAGDRSQPVERPIHGAQEAAEAYEGFLTLKAQRLLRMIEAFVGESAFHDGIRSFCASYLFRAAQSRDFWTSVDSKSNREVATWASRWFTQPGLPLVKVTAQCVGDRRIVSLEQMRLTLRQEAGSEPEKWTIPVGIRNVMPGGRTRYAVLEKLNDNFETGPCQTAIIANPGAVSYLRVWLEPVLVGQLEKYSELLEESDRVSLVSDVFATVQTQRTPVSVFMDLADRWRDDPSLNVWRELRHGLVALDRLENGEAGRERYQNCVCTLLRGRFERLGWEPAADESVERTQERAELIETLGRFGDRAVIDEAFRRFEALQNNPGAVPAGIKGAVLKVVGRYSSEATFKALNQFAQSDASPADRQLYQDALERALDPELIREFLDQQASLPNTNLTSIATTLAKVAETDEHADLVWQFVQRHPELAQNQELWRNGDFVAALALNLGSPQYRQEFVDSAQSFSGVVLASRLHNALMLHDLEADSQPTIVPALDAWVDKRLASHAGHSVTPRAQRQGSHGGTADHGEARRKGLTGQEVLHPGSNGERLLR